MLRVQHHRTSDWRSRAFLGTVQQQLALARVAGKGGGAFELGAGLVDAADDALASEPALKSYHLLPSVRGDLPSQNWCRIG